jgi:SEC-C motif domain protein
MEAKDESDARCPCLSGESYALCCGPLHRGETHATTAERLMRSRYSAFAVGDSTYLIETWHPSTRPESLELDPSMRWFSLEILSRSAGGMLDSNGVVEFRARYRLNGEVGEQRETSRFVKQNRRWFYLDGR